ncbi:MAG: flagellar export protein FliJ [Lachnospiraceae bacterium]|nr:flagellar export protein FliJ [Lachnospiraceae bacterium]
MAKFRYRMQNILDIKIKMETQEKNEFGIAARRLAEEEEKLEELHARQAGYYADLKEAQEGNLDIKEINNLKTSINTMKSLIRTQMLEVNKAQRELELARARLNEVMMERKTHENLKERDFEIFKADIAAQEAKEIDQLISFTHNKGDV